MQIKLSDSFTYKKLLQFTFPSIIMMIFTSIYGVVDGFFVSNFVGKTPFAAVNFIFPFIMVLGAFGFMFGTGGSALVSKTMGEGDKIKANKIFSMIVYISIVFGIVISTIGILFIRPIAQMLGAEGEMLDFCVIYGRIILLALPAFMLQMEFQSFFIAAEKPQLGLYTTIGAGVTNMLLDATLMGIFDLGIVGAALATALSQCVGGIIPFFYFLSKKNNSLLYLTKPIIDWKAFIKVCTNGSSELMSNISMSVVGMLYNFQLMKYAGENGVAAYGVLMYISFIFISVFIGYSIGTAPIVGFHYGANNSNELKSLLKKSFVLIGCSSLVMVALGLILANPLSRIFVGYDKELFEMTFRGFIIYSFSFLFTGVSIYSSSFFTALNNGVISASISFLRTLVFQSLCVLILPIFWKIDGVWSSIIVAELLATLLSISLIFKFRKRYNYI